MYQKGNFCVWKGNRQIFSQTYWAKSVFLSLLGLAISSVYGDIGRFLSPNWIRPSHAFKERFKNILQILPIFKVQLEFRICSVYCELFDINLEDFFRTGVTLKAGFSTVSVFLLYRWIQQPIHWRCPQTKRLWVNKNRTYSNKFKCPYQRIVQCTIENGKIKKDYGHTNTEQRGVS